MLALQMGDTRVARRAFADAAAIPLPNMPGRALVLEYQRLLDAAAKE